MKKILLGFISLFAISSFSVFNKGAIVTKAEEGKYVDGDTNKWEQETSDASTLADFLWDKEADTLTISGKGYSDRDLKFGMRCKMGFDLSNTEVTLKFPETFNLLKDETNNVHYSVAFANLSNAWWNANMAGMYSFAYVIRPIAQDKITVEVAGRWAEGSAGYGNPTKENLFFEYTLDDSRTIKVGCVKEENTYYTTFNGEKITNGDLSIAVAVDKTFSQAIEGFKDNKAYLHIGCGGCPIGDETMSISITKLMGTDDLFKDMGEEIVVFPESITDAVMPETSSKVDINLYYLFILGGGGLLGVGALVTFILSKKFEKKEE